MKKTNGKSKRAAVLTAAESAERLVAFKKMAKAGGNTVAAAWLSGWNERGAQTPKPDALLPCGCPADSEDPETGFCAVEQVVNGPWADE